MATQLFLRKTITAATVHLGTNNATLSGVTRGWEAKQLLTTRGSGVEALSTRTVTGPTNGVEVSPGTNDRQYEWITEPVSADVTISGAVTGNIWASESNMSANVAINFVVDVIRATDNAIVQIVKSARVTEVAITTRAVNNFTATPGAGVTVNRGDRIRVRIFGDDAGTMASGFTFNVGVDGTSAAADGDTYITFTETFGFESDPSGTTLYLTDTASDVATASVDREAWTSRGGGVVDDVTNTATGWTAPIQTTDTAGGTVVDWFTKQLEAFTLTGKAQLNLRAKCSNLASDASMKAEIARVDSDGTNPTVYASWCISPVVSDNIFAALSTTEAAYTVWLSGDSLAFTDGQRIRVRLYVDDMSIDPLVTGHTVTTYYNGTSGGASGDTFLILEQTVTEFVGGAAASVPFLRHDRSLGMRDFDPWSVTGWQ